MGFQEALRTCFAKYAKADGRASRSEFWYFHLAIFVYMFVYATQTKNLSRWTLSTPWDISTAGSKSTSSFSSGKVDTYASAGIAFAADGKRLVIATSGGPGDNVIEYSLGTAWNVTTISFISEIGFSAHQNYATGCCWGTK